MKALVLLLLLPGCGDYSDFQRWKGDETCIRVTDSRLEAALDRALDDWGPLPIHVGKTTSKECNNVLRWADKDTSGCTPNTINAYGRPQSRSIHVGTAQPDCRVDYIVAHEFGHFMGLDHSPSGLMYETFEGCQKPKVSRVDRQRLAELYK